MKTRYDDEFDEIPRDREISLGAPTILGIFFLIALVCAVFFGFGYGIGRKSPVAIGPATSTVEASSIKTSGAAKPAPGLTTPEAPAPDADTDSAGTNAPQLPQPDQVEAPAPDPAPAAKPVTAKSAPSKKAPAPIVAKATPTPQLPAAHPTAATAQGGAPALVQVAAVSHQEDADLLLNALKRRGYSVAIRHEPQDKLLHVQIGPLPTRKDADSMRQRLLADGYNAIVK